MVLYQTRSVTSEGNRGHFNCPQCDDQRIYRHKRVRKYIAIYSLPIIPLKQGGEYVECETCRIAYRPEVLSFDPRASAAAFEAEYHRAVKRVMVAMMLADGAIEDAEKSMIVQVFKRLSGRELSSTDIDLEVAAAGNPPASVSNVLRDVADGLNNHGKEMVIRAAFLVAGADGSFHEKERELLERIAGALDMTATHLNGVIGEMSAQ